jgi:hypothetical protein
MDFLFAALFFYALHVMAKRHQTHERLLIPSVVASLIAFAGMIAYDLTAPSGDQWLLVYAGVGLPFLILIVVVPWINRRIIYAIPPK